MISINQGDSVLVGGNFYSAAGLYIDSFPTVDGCDSIINTIISINIYTYQFDTVSICEGSVYLIGNSTYSSSGTYIDTIQGNGVFIVVETNLDVLSTYITSNNYDICAGESILVGSNFYSSTLKIVCLRY